VFDSAESPSCFFFLAADRAFSPQNSAFNRAGAGTPRPPRLGRRAASESGGSRWRSERCATLGRASGEEVNFLTSAEYLKSHSTPAAYVSGLYLDLLDRPPEPSEQIYWQNVLAQSGNVFVASSILTSSESYVRIITADYVAYLNRSPDPVGLQSWLSGLLAGRATIESVAEAILGSAEYANLH